MASTMKAYIEITATAKNLVNEVGKANKSLSMLEGAAVRLRNTLIGTFGAYQVIGAIRNTVSNLAAFDKQMASVRAISNATESQMNALRDSALSLGRATLYSATQVGELQVEFARLGFSTKEILDATAATVDLATATGEGLGRSAEIAGSTLRAFALDSTEMTRVTDVMAESLNRTALTLDSFADSIKYVSPVAHAVGVSLEETSAMLGILANAGIKGSQAGTSLRRIFTLLTNDGRPLQERLKGLSEQGITLANANDEVGLYAQTALLVLARELEQVDKLTVGLRAATGATKELAAVMKDNLAGDITRVKNSWDSLLASQSYFIKFARFITQGIQDEIDMLSGQQGFTNAIYALNFAIGDMGKVAKKEMIVFSEFENTLRELKKAGINIEFSDYEIKNIASEYKNADIIVTKYIQTLQKLKDEEAARQAQVFQFTGTKGLSVTTSPLTESTSFEVDKLTASLKQLIALREKPTVNALDTWIDELEEKIKASNSRGEIEKYQKRIEELKAAKDRLLGVVKKPDKAEKPDQGMLGEGAITLGQSAGLFDLIPERFVDDMSEQTKAVDEFTFSWDRLAQTAANSISSIIAADESLGLSIKKTTADVLRANAAQIASFLALKFVKDSESKGFIVAKIALAAGIAVVAGLLGKSWKKGKTPSPSSERASSRMTNSQDSSYNVIVKGQDLHIALTNYNRNNRSTSFIGG